MAKNGFKVLDSDMHVHEPWDLWLNYIDPEFRDRAPVGTSKDPMDMNTAVDWAGDENFVFSTDYPHTDSKYPHAVEQFLTLPLSQESKRKILWDNCARLYGMEVS